MGKSESRQDKRQQHRGNLRADDHPLPVKTIGNDASNGCKQENRNLAGKTHSPKLQTRPGQPVDEPRLRHGLHPRADQGDQLSTEEKLEVTVPKRPSRRLPPRRAAKGRRRASIRGRHTILRNLRFSHFRLLDDTG